MAEKTGLIDKVKGGIEKVRYYWNDPPKGRYMPFKEIAAYAGGGIGVYFIVTVGQACILSTANTLISSTLGVDPTDMYILYVIAILANIPLTGVRANIIDNTRNKAGKYRPYLLNMAIPTAIISCLMVYFPYNKLNMIVGSGNFLGTSATNAYAAKCALILVFNLFLHFFYYFFYDAFENLIHVMSPNTQERADVSSIKSVVYSLAPSIVNLITPLIAQHIFKTNTTDIRVYRLMYPVLAVAGILLCIVVYKNTAERIVQARTHVIQIKFIDALKAVAKNKYFWIISLAGWLGFLEGAFGNILFWLYNYGGACSGNQYALIITLYGNGSLWGMLLAPFCIRKWGKKGVLVFTNIMNIVFILLLYPSVDTIWLVLACLYMNAFMGSFAHILNPTIQADIRDYQQYKTGERIDGMFSAVGTIGNVITLVTSSVLPIIYEKGGITLKNAVAVTSNPAVLSRVLGDGKTVGEILADQAAAGQEINAYSALYDPTVLRNLLYVLIGVSAIGAFMNVVPYFWYDFDERKQKSVIKVLQVRAMFEDYGNHALDNHQLVEGIDMVRNAREMAVKSPKKPGKDMYKSVSDKQARKEAKKEYKAAVLFDEDIVTSQFVCKELDKFNTELCKHQVEVYSAVYNQGLDGLRNAAISDHKAELAAAKALPKSNQGEKEIRKFSIEVAKKKVSSKKHLDKYYGTTKEFKEPSMESLTALYAREDEYDDKLVELYLLKAEAKKQKNSDEKKNIAAEIKNVNSLRTATRKEIKNKMDEFAYFNRAALPYIDARKLLIQQENYSHFDEIAALYDDAKQKAEEEDRIKAAELEKKRREELEELERRKAEKAAKRNK